MTTFILEVLVCLRRPTASCLRVFALSLLFVVISCETPSELSILQSAPWASQLGWKADNGNTPCTLSGIGCNADGKVSSV